MKSGVVKSLGWLSVLAGAVALVSVGCGKREAAPAPATTDLSQPPAMAGMDQPAAPLPDPATVVVVVEGEGITQGAINTETDRMMARFRSQIPPERQAQMRDQMMQQASENLILRQLLMNAVDKAKVTITDEEVAEAKDKLLASLPEGVTIDVLMKEANMTEEEFQKSLRLDLSVNKLIAEQSGATQEPTEAEVAEFYEENKERFAQPELVTASHILISFDPTDDDKAKAEKRAKLEDIKKKLDEGADFATLAQENSDCPSKAKGGDLGSFPRGAMVPAFEEAAFTQEIGKVGPIVETQFGYHVILVTKRDAAKEMGLDDVKERIQQMLSGRKKQQAAQDYIEKLKENAQISYPGSTRAAPGS